MHRDPTQLSLTDLSRAYRQGSLLPTDVTEAYLEKMVTGPVYRLVTAERARAQAEAAERLFARGVDVGPLQGVPIAIKDLIDTRGDVTAAGSAVLAKRPPAPQDAPVAARLDAAGAVFLGKTGMTELAFSGLGLNPHFGTPESAALPGRVPGGSSSGSGVAVARGLACAAVGSDTGGSVRIPAAFNGLVGLKTTDSSLPLDGCTPLSPTLDTLGPIARTAEDAWHLWLALAARPAAPLPAVHEGLPLLIPETVVWEGADPEVVQAFVAACERLERLGHHLERRPVPEFTEILELYRRYGSFAAHESLALYEEMLSAEGDQVDSRVSRRILEFRGRPATDYLRLVYARRRLARAFWQDYRGCAAILCPTVAVLPPRIADLEDDDAYFAANALVLRNTLLFNFLGGPAASAPTGPAIGLMIATPPHQEALALGIAAQLERR